MIIEYSTLTNGPAEVIKEYIDRDYLEYKSTAELHTGVDVKCTQVYSVSPGVVKLIGNVNDHINIVVEADDGTAFNYNHLKSNIVEFYDSVQTGTYLGEADEYVHFEYLNEQQSRWPLRIGLKTWYKHDPLPVLSDGYVSMHIGLPTEMQTYGELDFGNLTSEIELSHNRGDDDGVYE